MTTPLLAPPLTAATAGPWNSGPANAPAGTGWSTLMSDLAEFGIDTPVTTTGAAGPWSDWLRREWAEGKRAPEGPYFDFEVAAGRAPVPYVRTALLLANYGLAVQDLFAVLPVVIGRETPTPDAAALRVLQVAMGPFAHGSVRDMVGWLLVGKDAGERATVGTVIGPAEREEKWDAVGLGDGWLYAAAGLTPAEARAGLDAGTLDAGTARVMASLRGASLPVGT